MNFLKSLSVFFFKKKTKNEIQANSILNWNISLIEILSLPFCVWSDSLCGGTLQEQIEFPNDQFGGYESTFIADVIIYLNLTHDI